MGSIPKQTDDLEMNKAIDGFVIYHPITDRVHFLNHSAAVVFELCNGRHTTDEIATILSKTYATENSLQEEVNDILTKLHKEELVSFI